MDVLHVILLAGLLCCSAFFSASETALFSLSREARRRLRANPGRISDLVISLLENPQELLLTVLFGNMLVNTAYYSISAMIALRAHQRWQSALIGVGALVVVILFGEVLPKNISVLRAEHVARAVALPLYGFQLLILPVRKVLGAVVRLLTYRSPANRARSRYVTADELKMLINLSAEKGAIDPDERDMIEDTVELGTVRVKEIMVPRVDVMSLDIARGMAAFRELVRRTRQAAVVVYEGAADNVIGILNTRATLLAKTENLRSLLKPPLFVPEVAPVERVLRRLRGEREHMAVVVDEYGGFAGVVTLEYIVEQIVGEIPDEFKPQIAEPVQDLGEGRYRLAGDLGIRDWADLFDIQMDFPKFDTLAGLVIFLLGRVAREGDTVRYRNLTFTVEKVHRRRIISILVAVATPTAQPAGRKEEGG